MMHSVRLPQFDRLRHQDVFLPDAWLSQLGENFAPLEEKDPDWA